MDSEKLIEHLKAKDFERDYDCTPFECGVFGLLDDAATALSTLQAENKRLQEMYQKEKAVCHATQAELEQVKRERDAAVKTIFKWTGCPECKYWNSADEWCEKHDREADSCGECDSPEWRGPEEE
ncbi:hypothetical protein [Muriventricola aceti]|jgi:hypothetical protein|uniref:hypothetical protein n=1 Tax=Muriventricola aceti TaxID=2981773 RepID=UPI000820F43C|nr:hypothetical protein [Muriventricola aceti]MCU6701918.1 hypothetical protein [Muriventricola aceti]SCI79818.1 Uncharacterised protein [uncultured Flavonifractor sp.]